MFSRYRQLLTCAIVMGLGAADVSADEPRPAEGHGQLIAEVQAIMAVKCAECHGGGGSRRGGMTLDLQELATHSNLVVPFRPESSRLWQLVRDGDMPEEGSKAGPLTASEKEVIRTWIASGAPVPTSPGQVIETDRSQRASLPLSRRLLAWLGKFHVLVIHFPIALLVTAAAVELGCAWLGSQRPSPVVRLCVLLGAAAAGVAVILGWLHADVGGFGGGSELLLAHRWLGTTAGLWAAALALWSETESRRGRRSWPFRLYLCLGALLVGATAHVGGILVHGERFLDW
jgi:mono/diheme cytochrome c family protein/uncharacterized membrane protein